MSTIPLQYVGQKEEHDDTTFGTGLWTPYAVRDVPADIAPYMLFHDGLWKDARKAAARKKDPITPLKPERVPRVKPLDPMPANLVVMNTARLADYAYREFGVRIDLKMKDAEARARVRQIMRERA